MAYGTFDRPWDTQPPDSCDLDHSHPLVADDGFVAWNFAAGHDGGKPVITTAFPAVADTLFGRGRSVSSAAHASWPHITRRSGLRELTVFAVYDFSAATNGFVFGDLQPGGVGYNFGLYVNGSNKATFFIKSGGTGFNAASDGVVPIAGSGLVVQVGTFGRTMGAADRLTSYANGIPDTSGVQVIGGVIDSTTSFELALNRWNASSANTGTVYLAGISHRCWSLEEVQEFTRNPWQIFEPRRILVPTWVAAAGGGSNQSPATYHLLLAGQQPTLNQPRSVSPAKAALLLGGYAPSVSQPVSIAPQAGRIVLAGYAPALAQPRSVQPGKGAVTMTGYVAQVAVGQSISPATGHITLTGRAPAIAQPHSVSPATGRLSFFGWPPTVGDAADHGRPGTTRSPIAGIGRML